MDLFDLHAKLTVDTGNAEKSLADLMRRVHSLEGELKSVGGSSGGPAALTRAFRGLSSSAVTLQGPLGGVAGRLGGLSSLTNQASTSAGALGVAFGVTAVGAVALGAAIFGLASHAADVAGKFYDMAQQTNFTVETLSGLAALAKTSGTNIDALQPSLVIFQKNLDKAGKGGQDLEKSLADAFKRIYALGEGTHQTAEAMKTFGRSGKDMLGVIKEANGDLPSAIKHLEKMGLILTGPAAAAADAFGDHMATLSNQLDMLGVQIGIKLMPTIEGAISETGRVLGVNENSWADWGDYISKVLNGVIIETAAAAAYIGQVLADIGAGFGQAGHLAGGIAKLASPSIGEKFGGVMDIYGEIMSPARRSPMDAYNEERNRMIALAGKTLGGGPPKPRGLGGGGGRGGGGGAAKHETDLVAEALKKQNQQIQEAILGTDQYEKEINRLVEALAKKHKALTDVQRAQLMANAETLRSSAAEKDYKEFMGGLRDQLEDAGHNTDEWDKSFRTLERTLSKNRASLKDFVGTEAEDLIAKLRLIDALKKEAEAMQNLGIVRQRYADILKNTRQRRVGAAENDDDFDMTDLGGGSAVARRRAKGVTAEDILSATRERRVTPLRDMTALHNMAGQLTNLLADSIHEGFSRGAKEGFATLLEGFARMLEEMALKMIESAIFNMLAKILGGAGSGASEGKGNIFSGALGKFAGGFAGGGSIPAGGWGIVGERGPEIISGGASGKMITPMGGGGVVINVYAQDARSFGSRETQRQIAEQYRKVLRPHDLVG